VIELEPLGRANNLAGPGDFKKDSNAIPIHSPHFIGYEIGPQYSVVWSPA
jgi:hypothetical protein